MINKPYEAIIIGSGATGGVAALTLAKAGIRVLIIERGPNLSLETAFGGEPTNTYRRICSLITSKHKEQTQHPGFWKSSPLLYATQKENPYSTPDSAPFIWTQGHQVGGRSLTWGGITLRLSEKDMKASRKDGYGPEWPINYSDLEPHYSSLERLFKIHGKKDGLEQLPDGEYIPPLPFTKSEEHFADKIKNNLGFSVIHSRGFGPYQTTNNMKWPRYSSLGSTIEIALKTGKVEILSNHIAEKLVLSKDKNSVKAVLTVDQKTGSRKLLKTKLVVICASTIQSIRLLLNSEEKSSPNGFIDPSGELGTKLMDHISTCRFFTLQNTSEGKISNKKEVLSGAGSFFIPFGNNYEYNADFIRGYGIWGGIDRFEPPNWLKKKPSTKTGFLIGHGEVLPYKDNKVTLSNEVDQFDIPIPHIDCKWKDNEKKMVMHMNKTIERTISAGGGKMLPLKEIINFPFINNILDKAIATRSESPPPGYYIHEVGGASIGSNKDSSVLDKWNRLWECKNVIVVDGASWPTSSWQSPTLTMMAITKRACENSIKDQKS